MGEHSLTLDSKTTPYWLPLHTCSVAELYSSRLASPLASTSSESYTNDLGCIPSS